jgi:hypothetical protein
MNYPNKIITKGEADKTIVKAIQTKLKTLGYYNDDIDGDYGKSLKRAVKRINPKLHVFGHIHEGSGIVELGGTTFVNACVFHGEAMDFIGYVPQLSIK